MLTRILTGVLGIPLVIFLMVVGSPLVEIAGFIIALIGTNEYYQMTRKKFNPITWVGYAALAIYFIALKDLSNHFLLFVTAFILVLLMVMVFSYPKYTLADVTISFVGPIYVGVLLSFIMLVRQLEMGSFLVWFIFISAWGSDTCAYFAGRFLGKHKLAPVLSPKKTIEGAIGGAIGASCIAFIYSNIYNYYIPILEPGFMNKMGIIVFIASLLSIVGDLAASAIKREMEAKDFGKLFPGHGGVLDRFDSVLFVGPFIYFSIVYFIL